MKRLTTRGLRFDRRQADHFVFRISYFAREAGGATGFSPGFRGAVGRGSARAGASRPLRPKRLNPQMNRRDLARSKLWCGQRQDVSPGCVWKTGTWSNLFVGNRSVSVWFMRGGEANREHRLHPFGYIVYTLPWV
jgi:hypothetical protein